MYKTYGTKGLWWCAFFLLTFACCDFISAGILKPFFHRIRPCNMIGITDISALVPCGHGFSFPSSHASNHFGLSFFIIFTLSKKYKHVVWLALLWALLVVYAQMYVGVHYPSDIIAGMFLGLVIGWLVSSLFRWIKRDLII
jgi:undecaprenyl-diphosphatase